MFAVPFTPGCNGQNITGGAVLTEGDLERRSQDASIGPDMPDVKELSEKCTNCSLALRPILKKFKTELMTRTCWLVNTLRRVTHFEPCADRNVAAEVADKLSDSANVSVCVREKKSHGEQLMHRLRLRGSFPKLPVHIRAHRQTPTPGSLQNQTDWLAHR